MARRSRRLLCLLLVVAICITALQFTAVADDTAKKVTDEDVMAGLASPSELYPEIDKTTVPDIIGAEEAVKKGHVKRLYEDEGNNLNQVVFLNADGTKTAYLYDFPVKYTDEKGKIRDISLTLADGNIKGEYVTASGTAAVAFPSDISTGITLSGNEQRIMLAPHIPSQQTQMLPTVSSKAEKLNSKTVSYKYDGKTSIEYSLTYTGFKEDIVVSEYTGQTEYEFTLCTGGLLLTEKNGSFYLVDDNGDVKATLGDIIVFTADERNNTLGKLKAETVTEGEEYIITIVLDADYLADEKTVYPIRIDPTVELSYENNGEGAIQDVTLNSLTDSYAASGSLTVGYRATYGKSRVLMRFPSLDFSAMGSNAVIQSASVEIRDLMCEGTEMEMSCHPFTGNVWNEVDSEWANVNPNSYGTAMSTHVISYANGRLQPTLYRYAFDITTAVRGWKDGTYDRNKGIIFKASSAVENGSTYNSRTFASYNRSDHRPSLSVTYTNDINPTEIYCDNPVYISLNAVNEMKALKFIPPTTGFYTIESFDNAGDPLVHLQNYNYQLLEADDDGGGNRNFKLVYHMFEGNTYYVSVGSYDVYVADCKVRVKKTSSADSSAVYSLKFSDNVNAKCTYAYKQLCRKFIPENTTEYLFFSSNATGDPKMWIYDSDFTLVKIPDDEGGERNFRYSATLTEGKTYYIAFGMHTTNTGEYNVNMFKPVGVMRDAYYLRNINTRKYVDIDGPYAQEWVHQWNAHAGMQERWYIKSNGDYYTIRSEYGDKYYVGISNTSTDVNNIKLYSSISDNTKWNIYVNNDKEYIFEPKTAEGKILYASDSSSGTKLQLKYIGSSVEGKNKWNILKNAVSYVNYYDKAFTDKKLLANIPLANEYADLVYSKYFSVGMYMDGDATHHETILDDCNSGLNSPCALYCFKHHKDIEAIYNQIFNEPRDGKHIYILWTDRDNGTYCDHGNGKHEISPDDAVAVVCVLGQPVIHFMNILEPKNPSVDIDDFKFALMANTLVHETAHVFGMDEQYLIPGHDKPGTSCVMENVEDKYEYDFYYNVKWGNVPAFCHSCTVYMERYISKLNIEGNN